MGISVWQILLIVVVVLLLFGANKIPRLMGDFAKGIKSFKAGMAEGEQTAANKPAAEEQQDAKVLEKESSAPIDSGSVKKDEAAKG